MSTSRLGFYTDLVELFFDGPIRFRAIVLAAEEMDAVRFHEADNELMFYKFYYPLLHHWILDQNRYRIFVDTKTNRVAGRIQTLERAQSPSRYDSRRTYGLDQMGTGRALSGSLPSCHAGWSDAPHSA